jgi:hypothetical protein
MVRKTVCDYHREAAFTQALVAGKGGRVAREEKGAYLFSFLSGRKNRQAKQAGQKRMRQTDAPFSTFSKSHTLSIGSFAEKLRAAAALISRTP